MAHLVTSKRRILSWIVLTSALIFARLHAEPLTPVRTVQDHRLISSSDPAVRIELPTGVKYVGADRWILGGVADCEIHVFVEADGTKGVLRLYVLQFEGYLPTRPELRYRNRDTLTTKLGGMDFFVRKRFGLRGDTASPGSEGERINRLLKQGGFKQPKEDMNVRFIHFLNEQMRQELLIFYAEDLALTGLSADRLSPGGVDHSQWAAISEALVQRATKAIVITSG